MEFKQAMRVIKRICSLQDGCEKCELNLNCPFITIPSELDYDKAEVVLAKWAAEHPEKTIADDFFERCPNAMKDDMKIPHACAKHCGYPAPAYCERVPQRCAECWRRPLSEVER